MPVRACAFAAVFLLVAASHLDRQPRPTIDARGRGSAANRRHPRRNRMNRSRPATGCLQPAARRPCSAADDRLDQLRRRRAVSPFRCDDPEPGNIKTSITRRDNIWQDDWIGLSLDALGTGQLSYHMMVNPSGVQADMLNSAAGGEDTAPDWIWDSAGRLTDTGYVEIRVPLQSIRFSGGANTSMGILFWRCKPDRRVGSVAALAPGVWVFERHAALRFADLRPRPRAKCCRASPTGGQETHETPNRWTVTDRGDVGFGGKIGLGPTIITLDATVNPISARSRAMRSRWK